MMWFWLNIPLAIVFIGLVAGLPLWAVLRHSDKVFAHPGAAPNRREPAYPVQVERAEQPRQLVGAG